MKLYKFKSGSKRDLDALMSDQLWISTLTFMNDPTDLGFYLKEKYNDADIVAFQRALNQSIVVASFSNVIQNRRLWNYYSDGMKGFVLTYRSEEIERAFGRQGNTFGGRSFKGKVSYGVDKYDFTEEFEKYLISKEIPKLYNNFELLFRKDESWKEEKEYRIAMTIGNAKIEKGILLGHVRPYEVGVGYKIAPDVLSGLREWCAENKITLRKYIPDFSSKKSNSPFKTVVIVKD